MLREKLFVVLLASTVLVVSNLWLGGYLFSYQALGSEIAAPAEALHEWHLNQRAPFEYRLLFSAIVNGVWRMTAQTNTSFYWSYVGVSFAGGIGAALAFFQLLVALGFSARRSLVGVGVFLLLPPFLLAFTLPVHTREDMLGYLLLCAGLLLLVRKHYPGFVLISVAGAGCRETLLILPFVFLFFTNDLSFLKRALLAVLPVTVWVMIRVLVDTNQGTYDPLEGLKWNLANPIQALGFAFIAFGPLWLGWIKGRTVALQTVASEKDRYGIRLLARSAPAVLMLILLTTFLGGIYNEIRLLYLGFPWVIALFMFFIKSRAKSLRTAMKSRRYALYLGGVGFVALLIGYAIATNYPSLVGPTRYAVPVQTWLTVCFVMFVFTLAALPLYGWASNKRFPTHTVQ